MNITSAGIGSGLDLEGIIEAYIAAEAVPTEVRLQNKEDRLTTELSGVGQYKSALSNFESILKKLSDTDDFNKQIVDVSSDDIAVTTNGFASNGSFDVEVQQLAKGSRVQSEAGAFTSSADTVGSGTLTFSAGIGADEVTFNVAIDASDDLSAIRDKINEQSENFGVTANVINVDGESYLSYSSEKTGDTNGLTITTSDTSLAAISTAATTKQAAQSATITVDGASVSSDTNEFKNIIEDVTIVAASENIGSPTTITLSQDDENGQDLVNKFVAGYNALIDTMDNLSNPETGELAFDPAIRTMKSQLVNIVTGSVNGLSGSINSLDDVGITLDKFGHLEVSSFGYGSLASGSEKLSNALDNNLNEIGELFASTDGVSVQLNSLLDSYIGSEGSITERKSSLSVEISGIKDEYSNLEDKLRNYEDTLRRKFTFLDQTVSQFNATSTWLTSTLSSLNGNNKD
jgi:flagellar hook-associated protein 2